MIYFDEHTCELAETRSDFDKIVRHEDFEFSNEPCRIEDYTSSSVHLGISIEGEDGVFMVPGSWVFDRYRKPTESEMESALLKAIEDGAYSLAVSLMIGLTEAYTNQKVRLEVA